MPPVATPFRASSRRSAGPQFASTPRFFLSQTPASSRPSQEIDSIDRDDFAYATPAPSARNIKREREQVPTPRPKEFIEDSDQPDDDAAPNEGELQSSSPPEPGELDAAFDEVFGSIRDRQKRRRVSGHNDADNTPSVQRRRHADRILSSSPDPPAAAAVDETTLSVQFQTPKQIRPDPGFRKPERPAETPHPVTPASINPSSLQPRRFVLSASQLPPSSQTQVNTAIPPSTATPVPSSQRRTPAFVLPRSLSPQEDDDPTGIPTPFSPSSRALRRRGRHRSAAHNYVPGGMAAEVRSWILEMGAKREQQQTSPSHYRRTDPPSLDTYAIAIRITCARQSALPSCGALAFAQGHTVDPSETNATDTRFQTQTKNVLLLGPPRQQKSRHSATHIPDLEPGDVVGVFRGLAWEVDLGEPAPALEVGLDLDGLSQSDRSYMQSAGKWHVGMEWELIL
ncbi:uncharacterized protein AKAW2_11659A [Aspergillus luchuensis]|uniref:Similar to An07g05780 n=1 Tax=Aspergillus kawachii TaxID=1069201 RepID=A0A146F283_ASPKA|nr:uncharacterized protein AKAW2_11659A [Aspergillus luchuensis]BCR94613.1 hypothetical protein AKAW2_11659A [Aspergillus luchuensis]BCS07204.1 hypothetical protein ALUC_11585A [Aspergillus luchuensis]GAA85258.1 similar to An07g05780 [Aspergillus luchuensis IFO 4308]GAT19893.1 similar to An07g05780 [Aspergillus luchuensis]